MASMEVRTNAPLLSAILVVGPRRTRSQRALDALKYQGMASAMQIIVADLDAEASPPLDTTPYSNVIYVPCLAGTTYGQAKYMGFCRATAPFVAFIEDHCYAQPGWAAALVEAHQGPWAAVGYSFINANPETYLSRASIVADYGLWLAPMPRGPVKLLPGNNVSYKRAHLLELGDVLPGAMGVDFNLHALLHQRGHAFFLESRAQAAHENPEHLRSLLRANYEYCRVMGAKRVETENWGWLRRIIYGLGAPLGAPVLKFLRLCYSMRHRRSLWGPLLAALPVVAVTYLWSSVGESFGYLAGIGQAERTFTFWEVEAVRAQQTVQPSHA